ncbi:MAG TPA: choice-of-anchor tandem repeat GloVer-containing protein [Terriglobales bacterium]|nr:choice-of-anchor tandem repeat GloVer-containing protein [Terriglobales bacterium]
MINVGQRRGGISLGLAIMLVPAILATQSAQAQTFTLLYAFGNGTDGSTPYAGLVRDSAGNLYGTTFSGGTASSGTVFKVDPNGKETVLHNFKAGADGAIPFAGLVRGPGGALYGTTVEGGASNFGTVFRLSTTGKETVLHSFNSQDGSYPDAGLLRDSAGNLYGATVEGGDSNLGTVFELDTTGKQTVLHSFTGGANDGRFSYVYGSLVRDAAGNFYGTTLAGGASDQGIVFKLDTAGTETVLYNFTGGTDGGYPYAGLVIDRKGNLYGTTYLGGASGQGTVFKLSNTGEETVLYSFTGGADGGSPTARLLRDGKGNLYGTTYYGGASNAGVVFRLDPTHKETVLHSFDYANDGGYPTARLIRDAAGSLYGTASAGGASNHGTVFKLTP